MAKTCRILSNNELFQLLSNQFSSDNQLIPTETLKKGIETLKEIPNDI